MKNARITKNEWREIHRLQRGFIQKVKRLEKRGVPRSILPPMETYYVSGWETRKELNKIKNEMKSFTSRSNLNFQYVKLGDIYVSKREYGEFDREQKRVNREEKKFFDRNKKKPFIVVSEEMQGIHGTVRTIGQDRHKKDPLKYTKRDFSSREIFDEYIEKLRKRRANLLSSDTRLQQNLDKAIMTRFGKAGNEIRDMLNSLSPTTVAYLFESTDILNFDFIPSEKAMDISDITSEDKIDMIKFLLSKVT